MIRPPFPCSQYSQYSQYSRHQCSPRELSRAPRRARVRAWLVALALCPTTYGPSALAQTSDPGDTGERPSTSCLIASDTGFYGAGGGTPARICLGADESADLSMGHTDTAHHYPVNRVEVAPGQELIVTDAPNFDGRIWRLRRSLQGAELRALGIHRHTLASARVVQAACFHEHDAFIGKAQCLGPGPLHRRLAKLDSSVSSVRVPPGYSVAVFRRVSGFGKAALYRADADAETLRRDGLHDAIRAVQVLRTRPACTERCAVAASDAWDLDAVRRAEPGTPGHTRLTFDLAAGRSFVADYAGVLRLDVRNGRVIVSAGRPRQDQYRRFDARTRYLTLEIGAAAGGTDLLAQIIESDAHETPVATHLVQEPRAAPAHALLSVRNTAKGALALAPVIHRFEWNVLAQSASAEAP